MMVLGDWIAAVRGADPVAHLRGTYDSRGSCQRETGFLRDPVAAVDAALAAIGGLDRADAPAVGDIAVLMAAEADGRVSPCGALWLGKSWALKGQSGVVTMDPRMVPQVLAIWSVGYEA